MNPTRKSSGRGNDNENRLRQCFENLQDSNRHALICYAVAGYPNLSSSQDIIASMIESGADIIEIGIPFSDPIADGPLIQQASYQALLNGITPARCFEMIKKLRKKFPSTPILIMTYTNILLKTGYAKFIKYAKDCGADGFILPDLPVEEAELYLKQASKFGMAAVFLASPNTAHDRLEKIVELSSGFVYMVSVYGITGVRKSFEEYTYKAIKNVKKIARNKIPVAVGFGISTPSHARFMINSGADGVIIGSAIINIVMEEWPDKSALIARLRKFTTSMKMAI